MNDKVPGIPDPGFDPVKTADALEQADSIVTGTLAQLRALPTPTGDEATLQSIFARIDSLVADYTQLAAALRAGDSAKVQQLQAASTADQKSANDASNGYGLTVCGS